MSWTQKEAFVFMSGSLTDEFNLTPVILIDVLLQRNGTDFPDSLINDILKRNDMQKIIDIICSVQFSTGKCCNK